jgi:hypothetical protein
MNPRRFSMILLTFILVCALSFVVGLIPSAARGPAASPSGVNADGYADLAIGVPGRDVGPSMEGGMVSILYGQDSGLASTDSQYFSQLTAGAGQSPNSYDHFGKFLTGGDFNGDGYVDLAVGVPGETISGDASAGLVQILYGSETGYSTTGAQVWSHANLPSQAVGENENFGSALASGDFDQDGFDDLAIGVPGQDFIVNAVGMVNVLYGTASGLTTTGFDVIAQGIGIEETLEENDLFGQTLAAGDFDGDGFHDLAMAAYNEDVGAATNAGVVQVVYGSTSGLSDEGDDLWVQGTGIQGTPEINDLFGGSLVVGDFDGNGYDELAIGAPREDYSVVDDGVVHVLWGGFSGLTDEFDMLLRQDLFPSQTNQANDIFGFSLAAGDFDGDGNDDLVIGAPGQLVSTPAAMPEAGVVHVIYGPLNFSETDLFQQDAPEMNDHFGHALAAADFDGHGYDDLAIGVPDENEGTTVNTGLVHILYGDSHGLSTAFDQTWNILYTNGLTQDADDQFGFSLVALIKPHTLLERLYLPLVVR